MRVSLVQTRNFALCLSLLAMTACGSMRIQDFNSWYEDTAHPTYRTFNDDASQAEIQRLRIQKQRYADVQTVPTEAVQQEIREQAAQPIRYRPDDNSAFRPRGYSPINPASISRIPGATPAFHTAQLGKVDRPQLNYAVWPGANAQ